MFELLPSSWRCVIQWGVGVGGLSYEAVAMKWEQTEESRKPSGDASGGSPPHLPQGAFEFTRTCKHTDTAPHSWRPMLYPVSELVLTSLVNVLPQHPSFKHRLIFLSPLPSKWLHLVPASPACLPVFPYISRGQASIHLPHDCPCRY